jgi:arsenate reductase (thioredoxin)
VVKTVPEVLFVCVHNAGSAPAHEINPAVRDAMAEIGLDISREFPKPLTDDVVQAADVVITMGCGDARPIYPGKRYLDWELHDPAGQTLERNRPIRDDIDNRDLAPLAELVGQPGPTAQPGADTR